MKKHIKALEVIQVIVTDNFDTANTQKLSGSICVSLLNSGFPLVRSIRVQHKLNELLVTLMTERNSGLGVAQSPQYWSVQIWTFFVGQAVLY